VDGGAYPHPSRMMSTSGRFISKLKIVNEERPSQAPAGRSGSKMGKKSRAEAAKPLTPAQA